MTKDLKRASLKKGPKGDKSKTPSKKGGGESSIVASPGMTKTSVVFQSRSLVERAEEAIKSLVKGTQKLDGKMWDTMKGMDVSMTKHYWSPAKRKKKDEEEADRYRCGSMQTLTPVYDGVAVTEATWRCSSADAAAAADWDDAEDDGRFLEYR